MIELKVTGNDPMSSACIWGLKGVAATLEWPSCNQRRDILKVSAGLLP